MALASPMSTSIDNQPHSAPLVSNTGVDKSETNRRLGDLRTYAQSSSDVLIKYNSHFGIVRRRIKVIGNLVLIVTG